MLIGQVVPEGLGAMPPGPGLARALADLDPTLVPNDDIVDVLQARSRQLAHDQAQMFTALSEVILRLPFAGPLEVRRAERPELYGPDEVRAALSWTRRAAESETDLAFTLVHLLPLVQAALLEGRIDRGKASVFARHLADLTPAQITAVCDAVLPVAPRLTTGQIAERIKRLILELDPAYYERRYRKAVRDRMVVAYLSPDGTAVISATGLAADEAAAAWERLDALARAARHDGHPATLDQIRADLVLGLLDGSLHGLNRAEILQALLERFAGHAESDTEQRTTTLVPTGSDSQDSGGHPGGTASPGSTVSGHDGTDHAGHSSDSTGNGSTARQNTQERPQQPPAPSPATADGHDGVAPARTADPSTPAEHRTTASQEQPRVGTEIRVPLSTLLELDQRPGEMPGWGFVPADAARRTVARQRRAQWRWVIVDATGHHLADGITRCRPSSSTRGGPRGGVVEIQTPESLLTTLAATPGEHGPWAGVIADIAAQYQAGRTQASTVTDLDAHPDDRFPRAALRRHIQVRDRTCIHPGCRGSARRADQDHTLDHARGGTTTHDDLAPLCRHDHMLKTEGGWELEQPEPGRFVWHSPLRRRYPVEPEPILPPPPAPVTRNPEPWFDDPAEETDHGPDLNLRDRAPPACAAGSTAPTDADHPGEDAPPF